MVKKLKNIPTGSEELLACKKNGVATITLNRPEVRNALSSTLTPALRSILNQLGSDPDVGALLITGAGKAFCSGGDVKGMTATNEKKLSDEDRIADLKIRQRTLTGALVSIRKPTIAALPGAAVGAGLSLALACDIRVAASSAFIATGYARVGLSGDYGISALLTRVVGSARARELMFTADRLDSEQCEKLGIFNRVVPDELLQSEAEKLASRLASGPREALSLMKDNLDQALWDNFNGSLDGEATRLIKSMSSPDHKEAVNAFIEKREPEFNNR